jgi:N-acetylglutamate synthase-like GNAT family acetyltransferase
MTQDKARPVSVSLHPATARDSEFAYRVKQKALRKYVEQVWPWNEDEQRRLHRRRFASQAFQVIEADGVDAGVLATTYEPDCLRVNQLLVLPEYQGKGVGRTCMEHVFKDASQRGLPVRLQVLKINSRAAEFYRRLGFHQTDADETHIHLERPA